MTTQEDADKSRVDLDFLLKKYGFSKKQDSHPDDEEGEDGGGFIVRFRLSRAYKALQRQEREADKVNIQLPWKKIKKRVQKPDIDEQQETVKVNEKTLPKSGIGKKKFDTDETIKSDKQKEKRKSSNSPRRGGSAKMDKNNSIPKMKVSKLQNKRSASKSPVRYGSGRKGFRNPLPHAQSKLKTSPSRQRSSSPNKSGKNTARTSTPRKGKENGKKVSKTDLKSKEANAKQSNIRRHQTQKNVQIPQIKPSIGEPRLSSHNILEHVKRESLVITDWQPEAITVNSDSKEMKKSKFMLGVNLPHRAINKVSHFSKIPKSPSISEQSLSFFLPIEDDLFNEDASSNFGGTKSNEESPDAQDKKKATNTLNFARYLYTLCNCQHVGKQNTLSKLQEKVKVSGVIQVYGCPSEAERSSADTECPFCTVFPRRKIHTWMDCIPGDVDRTPPTLYSRLKTARTSGPPPNYFNKPYTARTDRTPPKLSNRPKTAMTIRQAPHFHNKPDTDRTPPTLYDKPKTARVYRNPMRSDTYNPLSSSCWM